MKLSNTLFLLALFSSTTYASEDRYPWEDTLATYLTSGRQFIQGFYQGFYEKDFNLSN